MAAVYNNKQCVHSRVSFHLLQREGETVGGELDWLVGKCEDYEEINVLQSNVCLFVVYLQVCVLLLLLLLFGDNCLVLDKSGL